MRVASQPGICPLLFHIKQEPKAAAYYLAATGTVMKTVGLPGI